MHFHGFTTFNSKHVKTFKRKTCDMNAGTVAGVQQSPIDNPRFANLRRVLKSLADAGCGTIRFSGDASRSLQVPAWDCRAWQVIWTLPAWQWPKLKTRKYRPCDLPWSLPSTSQTESSWVKLSQTANTWSLASSISYLILSWPTLNRCDCTNILVMVVGITVPATPATDSRLGGEALLLDSQRLSQLSPVTAIT